MKKSIILFFLTTITSSTLFAQNIGFKGMKNSVELNIGTGYDLISRNYPQFTNRINIHPDITYTRTVGRRIDLGVRIGYDRVHIVPPAANLSTEGSATTTYSPSLNPNQNSSSQTNSYFFYPDQTTIIGFGINYQAVIRIYNRKYIAPVGMYHQFSAGILTANIKGKEITGVFGASRAETGQTQTTIVNPTSVKHFSYLLGNKKTFGSGVYINTSIEFNYNHVLGIYNKEKESLAGTQNSLPFQYTYPARIAANLFTSQLFEFKFGIGITI